MFRLKSGCCAALVAFLLPVAMQAQRPASTVKADAVGSDPSWKPGDPPPTSWIDPATGHRVVRVSQEPNSASFYFNVNAYTPDGKQMVYTGPDGVYVLDLATWKSRQVVKGHVFAIQAGFKTPTSSTSKLRARRPHRQRLRIALP